MGCKTLFIILFLFFAAVQAMGQVRSNKDLVGRWSATSLKLEFLPDGRVIFAMKGGSIPGARYKTDFTQTPPSLAIELVQKSRKVIYNFGLEFTSNKTLRLTTLNSDASNAFDKQRSVILMKDQ